MNYLLLTRRLRVMFISETTAVSSEICFCICSCICDVLLEGLPESGRLPPTGEVEDAGVGFLYGTCWVREARSGAVTGGGTTVESASVSSPLTNVVYSLSLSCIAAKYSCFSQSMW